MAATSPGSGPAGNHLRSARVRGCRHREVEAGSRRLEAPEHIDTVAGVSRSISQEPWSRQSLHGGVAATGILMRMFRDTNLWAYRLHRREPHNSERARNWHASVVADDHVGVNTQVLNALRAGASRKLQPPLGNREITALLGAPAGFEGGEPGSI